MAGKKVKSFGRFVSRMLSGIEECSLLSLLIMRVRVISALGRFKTSLSSYLFSVEAKCGLSDRKSAC